MNFKLFIKLPILVFIIMFTLFGGSGFDKVEAFSDQIIQRGATGDDVIELQSRLQYNGYYHGTIDGVYGWSTYWAVRNFQEAFGLTEVDGLAGQKTKDMLKRATKYNREFVYENLKKGNRFTHYGGVPWDIQSAPNQQTIEKAKKTAEARRAESEKRFTAQGSAKSSDNTKAQPQEGGGQAPKEENPQGGGQAQGGESPQGGGQAQGGENPQGGGQAQGGENSQGGGQAQGGENPQGGGQAQGGENPQGGGQAQGGDSPEGEAQAQGENPQGEEEQPQDSPEPAQEPAKEEAPPAESAGPTAVNVPGGFSQNDIQLMSNAVYGEARGEPYIGQVAVAAVILNRLNSATFPNTISGIIFEPLAFTAVADGQIWLTPNDQARKAVLDAINGMDPTGGATYYFNPETATSKWIWGRPQIKRIGKHIFCR
ncbi:cell wall hydrolase [Litchfieldia salsa]|uniref:Spore cortex-lytic enzyme n=1 Tax=Litchfieldia salsa TaxID=930152 RepID=A0A1H0WFR3_9BACI|nr:cell wall hydrolase [Litchfieldia salsa]SDP89497.1 N-acetylmuramoyl-L-alanine amidase [Litchfieldia salsa]